jgi:glycerol-3-phosphate acyltransferase PlsY
MDLSRTISLMIFAYMIGSIPFGLLVARLWKADLRTAGIAEVWRACGPPAAMLALIGDLLKGALPTLAAAALGLPELFVTLVGAAAIIGHVRPIFLRLPGGAAVSTSGGVLLALAPALLPIGISAWGVGFALTRMTAAGSLAAAGVTPIAATLLSAAGRVGPAVVLFCWALGLAIAFLHRGSIARMRNGSEPRFR